MARLQRRVLTVAHMAQWAPWILDLSQQPPAAEELTPKQLADLRNAYSLHKNKTRGHPVEHKLTSVPVGDAREAWKRTNQYFVKDTPGGRSKATERFWTITMENTGTNIMEWGALVPLRRNELEQVGASANADDMATVYLKGLLLPTFAPIQTALKTNTPVVPDGETLFDVYVHKVEDWADNDGHKLVSSGSPNSTKNSAFTVQAFTKDGRKIPPGVNPDEPCLKWKAGKCRFGDSCYRSHKGPGGCAERLWNQPAPKKETKPTCQYCQQTGHMVATCDRFPWGANPSARSAPSAPSSGKPLLQVRGKLQPQLTLLIFPHPRNRSGKRRIPLLVFTVSTAVSAATPVGRR